MTTPREYLLDFSTETWLRRQGTDPKGAVHSVYCQCLTTRRVKDCNCGATIDRLEKANDRLEAMLACVSGYHLPTEEE